MVSLNLCTDQLALAVAAEGQLLAVSELASDPDYSLAAADARRLPSIAGSAEAVLALAPDRVLTGPFTTRQAVALLESLGMTVHKLPVANDLDAITANLRRVGDLLGRRSTAERLALAFEQRRAELEAARPAQRRRALFLLPGGLTAGQATLAGAVLDAAGLHNLAGDLGIDYFGRIELEKLLALDPELLITERATPDGD